MGGGRLDRRRLALVADRFQSPHDGERLAALEAAGRLLTAAGVGWRDVIGGPELDDGPAAHYARCRALLRDAPAILSDWERAFLVGLLRFGTLTPKQRARLEDVCAKVEAVRGMAGDA